MKTCSKCNRKLDLSEFYFRKTSPEAGSYYEKCKECMKARGIWYYHQNHERQLALALIRKKKNHILRRKFLNKIKKQTMC